MLDIIFGPMFSGKTSKLQRLTDRYMHQGLKCRMVKYAADLRYSSDKVSSHPKLVLGGSSDHSDAVSTKCLQDILDDLMEFDVIAIDEGQFYEDIFATTIHLLKHDKIVIIAALDATFEQEFFSEQLTRLMPYAQRIEKKTAVCNECKAPTACTTVRIGTGEGKIVIGGADKYEARCLKCLFK